jgi:GR25 family glycosyltransferase involved in LPS biosynthesis
MKANVINLIHRTDRLKEIQAEFTREGLELVRHDGVNGQSVFFNAFKNKRMRGHAGCWQSHVNLLNKVKGTANYHLVIEDDAVLCNGFKEKALYYINQLPEDCGLCYFGGSININKNSILYYNDSFNQALKVLATHCYVIKDSHIDLLLKVLNTRIYKVDVLFTEYQNTNLTLISKNCLSWQRESFSDIGFEILKYNTKY